MMLAGASVVDITPGAGVAMGGYGARQGVSTGTHDRLSVRTLVLRDGAGATVAVAICDLVGVGPDILDEARSLVEAELDIPAGHVLVGATHTHSGPGNIRTKDSSGYASQTARKIAGSVQEALGRLRPVTLKVGVTPVGQVGQNRRHPDGPIQTAATVLLAAPEGGGAPEATLVNYACHATVLEHDNLEYSADWPGAMARFVERNLGGVGIYMQGCAGDINPVWMRHDFDEIERVGGILGAAATRTAHELRPAGEGQWAVNLSWSEQTPKEPSPGTVLDDVALGVAHVSVDLPRRELPPKEVLEREVSELEGRLRALDAGDVEGRRTIRPRLNELRMEVLRGWGAKQPGQTERIEVTAVRLGPECAIVTLPGEFHVEIGQDIERACGVRHLLLSGYTNGYIGYVPKREDFPLGGYEVGCARFEPVASEMVTQAAVDAVRSLMGAGESDCGVRSAEQAEIR